MSDDLPVINARTITRLWNFAQYVYSIGGVGLLIPVSQKIALPVILIFGPAWILMAMVGVPFAHIGLTLRFVVPGVLVWLVLRAGAEGGRPIDSMRSWLRASVWMLRGLRSDWTPRRADSSVRVG